jgi:hypothetical protein
MRAARSNSPKREPPPVLQRRHSERALSTICFGDVPTPRRLSAIAALLDPIVQISELGLEVCFLVLPTQSIRARGGVAFERKDVVRQVKLPPRRHADLPPP